MASAHSRFLTRIFREEGGDQNPLRLIAPTLVYIINARRGFSVERHDLLEGVRMVACLNGHLVV